MISKGIIATLAALVLAALTLAVGGGAAAAEKSVAAPAVTPSAGLLSVEEGKVTGSVTDQPASDVLDSLSAQAGFEVETEDVYLTLPLSASLDEVPLLEALNSLLKPFDYIMTFNAEGGIQKIRILGASAEAPALAEPAEAPDGDLPPTEALTDFDNLEEVPGTNIKIAPGTTITEREIQLFRELSPEEAEVPEDLYGRFYPGQASTSGATGGIPAAPPEQSAANSDAESDFLSFEPFENEFGPPEPDGPIRDLPPTIPEENLTGPTANPR